MTVNGGGNHGRKTSMNGHLAGMKEITEEDIKTYENGIQIIDGEKEFTPNLPIYLSTQNLLASGFNYHIVAVFGSQSTGKSTLLNHLFGTRFSVMDETSRRQTTKGIWMSRAVEATDKPMNGTKGMSDNILVMDVEGTDGRERGEDQDFERKSALFALATSEVMIVNIWEHQVGLYNGANMGLLKTVFEVNLGLFQKDQSTTHRSLLFFVIRDHIGNTPLENLAKTLLADLDKTWSSLIKPSGLEDSKISDFFDFEFVALAHKILQPDKFIQDTKNLQRRFREGVPPEVEILSGGEEDVKGGVFLPAYHRRIPADGFPIYAEGVWEQINTNKDLDLPSQQELLAQFRCDEIAASCTMAFSEVITPFEQQAASGKVLEGLGEAMKRALAEAVDGFEEAGGRYHKGVFQRKRDELRNTLEGRLRGLVVGQLGSLSKRALQEFTEEVTSTVKKGNSGEAAGNYDFAVIVRETRAKVINRFTQEASECFIPGPTTAWSNHEDELQELQKDLDEVAARLRREEMKRLVARLERIIRAKLSEPVELEFRRMDDDGERGGLWDRVWNVWMGVVQEGVEGFLSRAGSFNATEDENTVGVWRLKKKAWGVLKGKIEEEVMEGNILLKLRENFEDRFRYDDSGVPRVWKPTDDIEGYYTKAREATLKLIPLISHIRLTSTGKEPPLAAYIGESPTDEDEENDERSHHKGEFEVLSEAKQVELAARFKKTADAVYVEAKRSTISSVGQIPLYFYGLLLALGWNEIWAVLRSPIYFMFLLVCLALGYIVYTLNLWGPILRVSNAVSAQVMEVGKERLRDFLDIGKQPAALKGRKTYDDDNDSIGLQTLDGAGKRRRSVKKEDDDE